jgi:lysophospholipase L1-like esterase
MRRFCQLTNTISVLAILLSLVLSASGDRRSLAAECKLKKDDRIVFLGDSITAGGVRKDGYVTLVANAIAECHDDLGIEVIGAGISGHKVPDCQKRLDKDVLDKKPTIVVIYIGINDVWHWNRDAGTTKEKFEAGLHDLIKRSQDAGARVILCTPSVIGEKTDGSNQFDVMLEEYSAISRKVASGTGSQMVDLRKRFLAYLKQHNKDNGEKNVLTTDGVHLNPAGNRFVADCILEALGVGDVTPGRLLRHVVMFKFKDGTTEEDVQRIEQSFAALPSKINAIYDFEFGTDVSVEGKSAGFTHCFLVTFRSGAERAIYLPHPAHKEFVSVVGPHVDNVLVVDYWTR